MAELVISSTIAAPLARVWMFYNDPVKNLSRLFPPDAQVELVSADTPVREGSRVAVSMKGPWGKRLTWTVRIVTHRPPHAVVFGQEARFVDEQESGPFRYWRHEHEFEHVDEKTTRLTDRVRYHVPFGPLGWVADGLYVRWKLRSAFKLRHRRTREALET